MNTQETDNRCEHEWIYSVFDTYPATYCQVCGKCGYMEILDEETLDSIDRGMRELLKGQTINRGSFKERRQE